MVIVYMEFNKHTIISLFHILVVAPFLIYVGRSYGNMPDWMFPLLMVLGIGIFLHHGLKAYNLGLEVGWIYFLHAFIYAPVLFYIGYANKETFIGMYPIMIMLGFAALGYHLMHLPMIHGNNH
jgi:hypothetical protein